MPFRADSLHTIAVIGDIHGAWNEFDVGYFNDAGYDLLLFIGDLGGGTLRSDLAIARSIARLGVPALVIPGNNDATHIAQIAAEFTHQKGLIKLLSLGHQRRSRALEEALGAVQMCGYSLHPVRKTDVAFDVIACRPHSMGGPTLSFAPVMERAHGVFSLDESAARLIALIDEAESDRLLFLAHNGPRGLGPRHADIWGCDFKAEEGDWGDPDLEVAIDHAKRSGKQIMAVLGGHMHLRTKSGVERPWTIEKEGVTYINAARVPRVLPRGDREVHHHIALEIDPAGMRFREVFVDA